MTDDAAVDKPADDMPDMPAPPPDDQAPEDETHKAHEGAEPSPELADDEPPSDEHEDPPIKDEAHEPAKDDAPEGPAPVPGTPGNTGTVLHSPPVKPVAPPSPDSIEPSKTASTNPAAGVPILDSNHTLSHIPPRDSTPL